MGPCTGGGGVYKLEFLYFKFNAQLFTPSPPSRYRGGGGIPCGGKYESINSGATKSVPLLKNEQTNYVWFPIIAHETQWALAVITCTNP